MKLFDRISNLLGFACLAATLVLALPGIQVVGAEEPVVGDPGDLRDTVSIVGAEPKGAVASLAGPMCARDVAETSRGPRPSQVGVAPPGRSAAADGVALNTTGYGY